MNIEDYHLTNDLVLRQHLGRLPALKSCCEALLIAWLQLQLQDLLLLHLLHRAMSSTVALIMPASSPSNNSAPPVPVAILGTSTESSRLTPWPVVKRVVVANT